MSENDYEARVFIEDAIISGAIEKIGVKYQLPGGDILGFSISETMQFLSDKRNQEIKLRIKKHN